MTAMEQLKWIDVHHSSRCKIPRFVSIPARSAGYLGLMFASFVGSAPFLLVAFFYFVSSKEELQRPEILDGILTIASIFAMLTFPLAAFVLQRSLLCLLGQSEFILNQDTLRVVTSVGPIWSTRRVKLSSLGGFRIENPRGDQLQLTDGLVNLIAVKKNGSSVHLLRMYPDRVVLQLANLLPRKIDRITAGANRIWARDLQAEVVANGPFEIGERSSKPIGSDLSIDVRDDGLTIRVPRLGYSRSTSAFAKLFFPCWMIFQLFLSVFIFPALLSGKVMGDVAGGWLLVTSFTAVSVAMILYRYNKAIRNGSIHLARDGLALREHDVLGEHFTKWRLDSIEGIDVGVEQYKSDESIGWEHFIRVKPNRGKPRQWFSNRTKAELEWIATTLRRQFEQFAPSDRQHPLP